MAKKEVTKKQSTEVVETNWEQEMAEEAKAVAKTERVSTNKINFQSGVMTFMDQAIPDNKLDCIILAGAWENVIYAEKWKSGVVVPPLCFALGMPEGENPPVMIPHDVVTSPQHENCTHCPNFKFNSDPEGGRGKACKERRRLAVIPQVDTPEEIEKADMAVMSIPVMSVKNWASYVNTVAAKHQRPVWGMLTKVSLVPDSKSQFRVKFEDIQPLDSEFLPHVHARIAGAVTSIMTPYEMTPGEEESEEDNKKY